MTVIYNGYEFGDYSHVNVDAVMVEDEAQRTVAYHRYKVRVQTIIVAEAGDANVGAHFRRMRQLLTKQGQQLTINHAGFGPELIVNASSPGGGITGTIRDVAFGPKPRILNWDPVGATNAVEVVWECEFCIPTCDGGGNVRYKGIESLNYTASFRINESGYTTRTVTGHITIAMTASGQSLPDTADAYRNYIIIQKPVNFSRETTWNLSADKRRAEFSITDREIESPNAYPSGVIRIRANHRVSWARRAMSNLPNVISATITLVPNQSRARAWEIFRGIVQSRTINATANLLPVFLDSLEVDEDLYGNTFSFQLSYRVYTLIGDDVLGMFFPATGVGSPLPGYNDWNAWDAALQNVQTHRGLAQMGLNQTQDQIVSLCTDEFLPEVTHDTLVTYPAPLSYYKFCNPPPTPRESWLRWESNISLKEPVPTAVQITMGRDDLKKSSFDPEDPTGHYGETTADDDIRRFIEECSAMTYVTWTGYAERVGYLIPRPRDKYISGNIELIRVGEQDFRSKHLGVSFCQNVYAASWKAIYVVHQRPTEVTKKDANLRETANPV